LIDRDDRSEVEIQDCNQRGISVLYKRDIESYLWADEILEKLCENKNRTDAKDIILSAKNDLLAALKLQRKPVDDVKSIRGQLYTTVKKELELTGQGNTADAFAKQVLAPLIVPGTTTYQALHAEIFGPIDQDVNVLP